MLHVPNHNSLDRRQLLKGATAAGLAALLDPQSQTFAAAPAQRDLIRSENSKPGTTDWQLQKVGIDRQSPIRSPQIEGYCSRTSLHVGETLQIMVSTNPPSPFVIDIYRLGYYEGKGGRHLQRLGPFHGSIQPDPEIGVER